MLARPPGGNAASAGTGVQHQRRYDRCGVSRKLDGAGAVVVHRGIGVRAGCGNIRHRAAETKSDDAGFTGTCGERTQAIECGLHIRCTEREVEAVVQIVRAGIVVTRVREHQFRFDPPEHIHHEREKPVRGVSARDGIDVAVDAVHFGHDEDGRRRFCRRMEQIGGKRPAVECGDAQRLAGVFHYFLSAPA